jgi:hypothetical protein
MIAAALRLSAVAASAAHAAAAAPNPVVAVATGPSDWNMGYAHTEAEAGISWYTHMWKIFPSGVPQSWGIGMPGTWLHGTGISFKDACACNPKGWPNNPAVSKDGANGCCNPDGSGNVSHGSCSFLYETIEGGPQDDERWRTMANVGCFAYTGGTGIFLTGGNGHPDRSPANQHPCGEIAFVSLSNQMVMQPNGASFAADGMLGVGYVNTPLGKVRADDARSFWTLVFDTANFSGAPGRWSHSDAALYILSGILHTNYTKRCLNDRLAHGQARSATISRSGSAAVTAPRRAPRRARPRSPGGRGPLGVAPTPTRAGTS